MASFPVFGAAQAKPHLVPPPPPPRANQVRPQLPAAVQSQQGQPVQSQPRAQAGTGGSTAPLVNPAHPGQMQQHIAGWMEAHNNLPVAQQHAALDAEPGFHNLNPEEQQRLHTQLSRLQNMPPEQQKARIAQNEALEKLSPSQRQQFRATLLQLGGLPEARRLAVGRTFRMLRDMPEPQRQAYMNSPQYHSQFDEQERSTISNLVNIAPLLPAAPTQPH